MHRSLVPVGFGSSLWKEETIPLKCVCLPVHCAQSTASAYTYLDAPCRAVSTAVFCPLAPLENRDQMAPNSVSHPLRAQRRCWGRLV